jgi:hypothetical protein
MINLFKKQSIKYIPIDLMPQSECAEILKGEYNNPLIRAVTSIAVRQIIINERSGCEMAQTKDYTHAELTNELGKAEGLNTFLEELTDLVRNKRAKTG